MEPRHGWAVYPSEPRSIPSFRVAMSAPAHDPDDAVLIAAVLRGETQQFGELVRENIAPRVMS